MNAQKPMREPGSPLPRPYVDAFDKQAAEICGDPHWLINVAMEEPRLLEDRIAAALRALGTRLREAEQHRDEFELKYVRERDALADAKTDLARAKEPEGR